MNELNRPSSPTDQELIAAYFANFLGDSSSFWAFEDVTTLTSTDPERLWVITLQMISQTTDKLALSYVAAGPLEDLLAYHGPRFIDRVEAVVRRDAHFLEALRSVWGHGSFQPDVYARIQALVSANA